MTTRTIHDAAAETGVSRDTLRCLGLLARGLKVDPPEHRPAPRRVRIRAAS